ncbi:MAG: hypothetical protein QMD80_00430 [archaeon]|nr:hypothetical protein [archaeon]
MRRHERRQVKFVADECVDRQIVDRPRQEGHEVLYIERWSPGFPMMKC